MSQKEVWKDNRTGKTTDIDANGQNWLSSVVTDKDLVDDTTNQPRQENEGDRGQ